MKIVGTHLYHDGGIAVAVDGELVRYVEASKDNGRRYADLGALSLWRLYRAALMQESGPPDVLAVGGYLALPAGGYSGVSHEECETWSLNIGNTRVDGFTTTHERAHVFCSYALSDIPQGEPCYALVYEGLIGALYRIDEKCNITRLHVPMTEPGHRYAALFELADPSFPDDSQGLSMGTAGKLMALASRREGRPLDAAERELTRQLLELDSQDGGRWNVVVPKKQLRELPFWNVGHLNERFREFATRFQDAIFDKFHAVATQCCRERLPLIISGGCGLNCHWNSRWRDSGLFRDVFVPPCADDSGIAVGVAADAQHRYTGNAKLRWSVYCGEPFEWDVPMPEDTFASFEFDPQHLSGLLCEGAVVAWVQGRYELGPRALGNRSLLAAPFDKAMTDRLNWIKHRESYRPVAPVCLEEEVSRWFDWTGPSPHMLYFQKVTCDRLAAVTHDDASARVQTVSEAQNSQLYRLLRQFSQRTGVGVLCNTSLNFPGRGFINRMSDLLKYVIDRQIEVMVVDDRVFVRRKPS